MNRAGSCEGCIFYRGVQDVTGEIPRVTQVYRAEAPDATRSQIDEAINMHAQMAVGAEEALPDCPGHNRVATLAWYVAAKMFGDKGDVGGILYRQCNNPFIKSEEFLALDEAAAPHTLQTEALKVKGEYDEEAEPDLKPWPPSKVIKNYREAYRNFGITQKITAWALPTLAGLSLIGAIQQQLHPADPIKARFDKLQNTFEAQSYSVQDYSSFSVLAYLTPEEVRAHTTVQRYRVAQNIQDSLANVSLAGFKQGLDNKGEKVDMYDLAQELIPDETKAQLKKEGFRFKPLSPVHCDIRYINGFPPYIPLDYSNRTQQNFTVTNRELEGKSITTIPLGSEDVTTTGEECVTTYKHKVYPPNNSTYPANTNLQIVLG